MATLRTGLNTATGVVLAVLALLPWGACSSVDRKPIPTVRKGSFEGPMKQYRPTGFVRTDRSNAVWGMQFVWPIKAEYLIVHLDDEYTTTVVARHKRDHAWIMSRIPTMQEEVYVRLVPQRVSRGCEEKAFVRVPQRG